MITLPKDFAGDLDIRTNVGDLDFGEFTGVSLVVDSDVGNVTGSAEAEEIEIESNVGEIDVTVNGGKITLKSDVGGLEFLCEKADSLLATSDVAADSGVGEVDTNISFSEGKDRSAAIQIYTDIGDVEIYKQ